MQLLIFFILEIEYSSLMHFMCEKTNFQDEAPTFIIFGTIFVFYK